MRGSLILDIFTFLSGFSSIKMICSRPSVFLYSPLVSLLSLMIFFERILGLVFGNSIVGRFWIA